MGAELDGAVAVVTGANGRLGRVWRSALIGAGAVVVGLDVTVAPDGGANGRYLGLQTDVTDQAGLRTALRRCLDEVGPPSVLVNNAGIDQPPSAHSRTWLFGDIPDEVSGAVLEVNALGALRACQVFGPVMAECGGGSVVNIGSLYGSVAPDPYLYRHLQLDPPFLKPPSYGMSKAALAALTRYLAVLWGPAGIRVNTLSPGGVRGGQDERFVAKYVARVPMRRMADPEDLVGPLLFLVSDHSRYVTGTELVVDGGFLCL